MLDTPLVNLFSDVKPGDTAWRQDDLRDFFPYRDLGIEDATGGRVIAHLAKANRDRRPPRAPAGTSTSPSCRSC